MMLRLRNENSISLTTVFKKAKMAQNDINFNLFNICIGCLFNIFSYNIYDI